PLKEAQATAASLPLLFGWRDAANGDDARRWTGWALLTPEHIAAILGDPDEDALRNYLLKETGGPPAWFDGPRPVQMCTFDDLFASHRAVLGKTVDGLMLGCREADPGIWLSRNVKLHPTARFEPPVFVGENCDVGPGVMLGPNAA